MTTTELLRYHPANNYVLLTPAIKTDKLTYGSLELQAPLGPEGKPYDIFKSQPVICTVISVPRKLICGTLRTFYESISEMEDLTLEQRQYLYKARKEAKFSEITTVTVPAPMSMKWHTKMKLKSDDIVWVSANALLKSDEQRRTVDIDGKKYYLVQYEHIYMRKVSDGVQMLNGWLLAEVIDDVEKWIERAEKSGLVVPAYLKKRKEFNDRLGVIRYAGEPVDYLLEDFYDHRGIKAGDIVMFSWKINRRLEPGNKYFAKDSDMIVTRRANIMAIME